MKLTFSEIRDTIDGAIDYLHRISGAGTAGKLKEAIPWGLPGYFYRPNDADETATGTEDCLLIEQGDHRHVIATRNATAWGRLLDYLGRAFDRGESILSSEDGTNRCIVDVRPNGDVLVKAESATKSCAIEWDASTGDVNVTADGDINLTPTGEVKIGGVAATDYVTLFTQLKTEYDLHVHACPPPLGNTGVPTVPLTNNPRSTKGRAI